MDDLENIARKTWARNMESVQKIGYMDGAADGQASASQSNYNMGYKQGFFFGKELGSRNAVSSQVDGHSNDLKLKDPRKINCNLCMNDTPPDYSVDQLYNIQQELNTEFLNQEQTKEN